MPPKDFQPKNDESGAEDCRPEHYAKRCKRLIPAGREAGQLLLHQFEFLQHLRDDPGLETAGNLANGG